MSEPVPAMPAPANGGDNDSSAELKAFVTRLEARVRQYLAPRSDNAEQTDHLRHVADRTRWIYYSELQRETPGASVRIGEHEDDLIEACVLGHDIGKWLPRPELRALIPDQPEGMEPIFHELKFTINQSELFLLGIRRRFALEKDGYTPEYDSAHHLVSAYLLAADPSLGFHRLDPADRKRLVDMIVGHQFGSYFKESLFNLSQHDTEVTTGMLRDVARPDRVYGDMLASSFHDADISDLLFIGSLERRPNREDIFHPGGLVKILLINFTNLIFNTPHAPRTIHECLRSCQFTVTTACDELITQTAIERGVKWRKQARRFLGILRDRTLLTRLTDIVTEANRPAPERVQAVRVLTYMQARSFLKTPEEE